MRLTADEFGRQALEQLDTLARVAASLTGNRAEADDLVQETFVRALRAREQYEPRTGGIRPWLLRIMHNTHLTRRGRRAREPVATDPVSLDAGPGETFPNISEGTDESVRAAMAELPADLRTALTLWAVEGLSYKEMADVLEIPIGTVMSRLYRARHALAGALRKEAPELVRGSAGRYG